jgi:hypothetical protein
MSDWLKQRRMRRARAKRERRESHKSLEPHAFLELNYDILYDRLRSLRVSIRNEQPGWARLKFTIALRRNPRCMARLRVQYCS